MEDDSEKGDVKDKRKLVAGVVAVVLLAVLVAVLLLARSCASQEQQEPAGSEKGQANAESVEANVESAKGETGETEVEALNEGESETVSEDEGSIPQTASDTSSSNNGNSSTNSPIESGNGNSTTPSAQSGGKASNTENSASAAQPTHTHNWVYHAAEYTTVHHDAVYSNTTIPTWICQQCGARFSSAGAMDSHLEQSFLNGGNCYSSRVEESTQSVLVQDAWDEPVLVRGEYYSCSCGATK